MWREMKLTERVASILAALYLVMVLLAAFPPTSGMIFSRVAADRFGLERALAYTLFALFLIGYFAMKRVPLVAGLVFILWYGLVWWMELFSLHYGMGGGMAPLLAVPVLLLGLVLVARDAARAFRSPLGDHGREGAQS